MNYKGQTYQTIDENDINEIIRQKGCFEDVALASRDLSGKDFNGCSFAHVLIIDCDLTDVDMANTTFRDVTIDSCDIMQARFYQADMQEMTISDCAMTGTDLFAAKNVENVTISGCELQSIRTDGSCHNVTFDKCVLYNVEPGNGCNDLHFTECHLSGFNPYGTCVDMQMEGCTIHDVGTAASSFRTISHMGGVSLSNCTFDPHILDGTDLSGVTIVNGDLSNYVFKTPLDDAMFVRCNMENVQFQNPSVNSMGAIGCDLRGSNLHATYWGNMLSLAGSNISGLYMGRQSDVTTVMTSIIAEGTDFTNVTFAKESQMQNADLRHAKISLYTLGVDTHYTSTDFTGVTFPAGDYTGVHFHHANLSDTQMSKCSFNYCNFEDADMSGAICDKAFFAHCEMKDAKMDADAQANAIFDTQSAASLHQNGLSV